MKQKWQTWILAPLLIIAVFPPVSAQTSRIEISGVGYPKSVSQASSQKTSDPPGAQPKQGARIVVARPEQPPVTVVTAKFGNEPLETDSTPEANDSSFESITPVVYATEYSSKTNAATDRKFRSLLSGFRYGSGTGRPSDIGYGVTGGVKNNLHYGSGMGRSSDISYGVTGGAKNHISYGSGMGRSSDIQYGVTGGARNGIRYGSQSP